jgi:hypothetical protein
MEALVVAGATTAVAFAMIIGLDFCRPIEDRTSKFPIQVEEGIFYGITLSFFPSAYEYLRL